MNHGAQFKTKSYDPADEPADLGARHGTGERRGRQQACSSEHGGAPPAPRRELPGAPPHGRGAQHQLREVELQLVAIRCVRAIGQARLTVEAPVDEIVLLDGREQTGSAPTGCVDH